MNPKGRKPAILSIILQKTLFCWVQDLNSSMNNKQEFWKDWDSIEKDR